MIVEMVNIINPIDTNKNIAEITTFFTKKSSKIDKLLFRKCINIPISTLFVRMTE